MAERIARLLEDCANAAAYAAAMRWGGDRREEIIAEYQRRLARLLAEAGVS